MASRSQTEIVPSIDGILAAREVVYRHLNRTPLANYPLLDAEIGTRVLLKHENHLPTGAFKIRGGLNLLHQLAVEKTHKGVITATRGNHGQSLALAARLYGLPATVVVPFGNNPEKNEAMRAYGAQLVEFGRDFDEAREESERIAVRDNLRYVHPANEPLLVNGVGTYGLEMAETLRDNGETMDVVLVPIGLGSGICGVSLAFSEMSPKTRIIGVQAEGAPSVYLSWKANQIVTTPQAHTIADGVATRVPAELTLGIIRKHVDEIVLVTDSDIIRAIRLIWKTSHNLVEGAGACAVAAAVKLKATLGGKTVGCVLTGANLDSGTITTVFSRLD